MSRIIEFIQKWRDDDRARIAFIVVGLTFWLSVWIIREIPTSIAAGTTLASEGLSMTAPVPASVKVKYEYFDGTGLERQANLKNYGRQIFLHGPQEIIIWLQPAVVTNLPTRETNYRIIPGPERLKKELSLRFGDPKEVSTIGTFYDSISVEDGEVWHYPDGSTLIWFYPVGNKLEDFVVAKTPSSCPNPEDETCQVLFKAMSSVSVLPKSESDY